MKKILILLMLAILLVVSSNFADAQDEKIRIALIEYNTETNFARIEIQNNLQQDLRNVKFQFDTLPQEKITSVFKAGATTARIMNVPAGLHKVRVISDEFTVNIVLSFSASIEEKQEEFERKKLEQKRSVQKEKIKEDILTKNTPTVDKDTINIKIIAVVLAIIVAILIYIIIKKRNESA